VAKPSRLVVISDLHLGGSEPYQMSQHQRLAGFVAGLPKLLSSGEVLDLVIAGDFVDFLATAPWSPWTPDPEAAVAKLASIVGRPGQDGFAPIFDALGEHVAAGHRLTVLLGNHDLELTLPPVRRALLDRIGADPHQVLFVFDGSAYRVGGALVEHGNRYDDANANDFSHLRALASFLSRAEPPTGLASVTVSTGSQLVTRIVNPIKKKYPFIDLFKPEGELLAYLLFSFEPSLVRKYIADFGLLFEAQRKNAENADGKPPGATENVAGGVAEIDAELREAFGDLYQAIRSPARNVGFGELFSGFFDSVWSDSVSELVSKKKPIPRDRLARVRVALRRLLANDHTFDRSAPDGQYTLAAERLCKGPGVETVVMGHTHLARQQGDASKAWYINTGTWADLVTVPKGALEDGADDALAAFLVDLVEDRGVRSFIPTYADVLVAPDGHVVHAALRDA
jgi:UDP-2,3-diacylglucosamine pyrophosphatase LpxH